MAVAVAVAAAVVVVLVAVGAVNMVLEAVLEEAVLELCGAAKGARGPRKDVRNGKLSAWPLDQHGAPGGQSAPYS